MKLKLSILALSLFFIGQANAQTFNPSNFTQAVQSVNTGVLNGQGIAQTSSQSMIMRSNVSNFMSNAIKGAAASFSIGTVARVLVSGATGALLTYAVVEGTTQLVKTLTANPDGQITYTNTSVVPLNTPSFAKSSLGWGFAGNVGDDGTFSNSPSFLSPIAYGKLQSKYPGVYGSIISCRIDGSLYGCDVNLTDGSTAFIYTLQYVYAPIACGAGSYVVGGACTVVPGQTQQTPQTVQPEALGGALPVPELNAPVSPQSMADLINRINAQMATNPANMPIPQVTAGDVGKYVPSSSMPKVGDITSATNPTAIQTDPNVVPKVDTTNTSNITNNTSNITNNTTTTKVDLGPDPGIGRPVIELETTPTGSQILAPILNMLPSYKNLVLTNGGSISCPFTNSFYIETLKRSYSFSSICTFMADIGPTIRGAMTAMFGILSIIIILGA